MPTIRAGVTCPSSATTTVGAHQPGALSGSRPTPPHHTATAAAAADGQQPAPMLFILADDLGWSDLSNEGSHYYESPHIDSIAAEGMKFLRGYAASRVCSPSRASIMTGKYTPNHGITSWIGDPSGTDWRRNGPHDSHLPAEYEHGLRAEELTLAEVLLAANYRTFYAGKYHLGTDAPRGFELNKGGHHVGSPPGGYFSPYSNPALADGPAGDKTVFFRHLYIKNEHFTKTGSGQT
jgi:arylsulfatase A-like enzyme